MIGSTILLISRDEALAATVRGIARGVDGLGLATAATLDDAYNFGAWDRTSLVLIHQDRRTPMYGVVRLLRMIAAARRPVATVILADGLDEAETTDLYRLGVADLLPCPFDLNRLAYLAEVLTLRSRRPVVTRPEESSTSLHPWAETDPVVVQARRVAPQDTTVLIGGEAGTGKSRLARLIHDLSPRRNGPFVALRCAAIAPDEFEPELFGPLGEPTADGPPGGKLGEAREGTLLLEDVDALGPRAQVALLRYIEGAEQSGGPRSGRPRLIASTRVDLVARAVEGRFRSDLFYRLNVIGLQLVPLRQRRTELGALASAMLTDLSARSAMLSPEAAAAVEAYPWPGNFRELREALEAALVGCRGAVLGRESLPEALRVAADWPRSGEPSAPADAFEEAHPCTSTLAQTKREAEYARITQALEKHGHNRLRTASELGISRMTLYKKLYKYGIIEQEGREGRRSPGRARRPGDAPAREDVPPGARYV